MLVTVTFRITPEQQAALARVHGCESYEVGTVILDPFIRQAVSDAFDRVNARPSKAKTPVATATMTITRKRKS